MPGSAWSWTDHSAVDFSRLPPPSPPLPPPPPLSPPPQVQVEFSTGEDCAANGCRELTEAECKAQPSYDPTDRDRFDGSIQNFG